MSSPQDMARSLLERWRASREHPRLWLGYLDGTLQGYARIVSHALLDPHTPERMIQALVDAREWTCADLLLEDELFQGLSRPLERDGWRRQIEHARAESVASWQARIEALQTRADSLNANLNVQHVPGDRGERDDEALRLLERQVEAAAARRRESLRQRVETLARQHNDSGAAARWKGEVLALLERDAPEVQYAIDRGPTPDPVRMPMPVPASRALSSWELRPLLAAMLGDDPCPAMLNSWLPPLADTHAWRLLEALYRPTRDEGDVVLRCLAALVGTQVQELRRDADGWTGRIQDLSAPGFLALGRTRWPEGVPVWLPVDPMAHPPTLAVDGLLVRLCVDGRPPRVAGQLVLEIREVLATLRFDPDERRRAILATLGAQIPLDRLYSQRQADLSAAWPGQFESVDPAPDDPRPRLVSAPPGLGKTVLLHRLAAQHKAQILTPADELPERGAVLIDCVHLLDVRQARELVRAIHWISDQEPPPLVVVVARPEVAQLLDGVRGGFFLRQRLEPLPPIAARDQVQALLAWGGLQAQSPHMYDQIALLSGGNPAALFAICEAVAVELSSERPSPWEPRVFGQGVLDRAWARQALRDRLRVLTWEPLTLKPGARALAQALTRYSRTDGSLDWPDLTWAFRECGGALEEAELRLLVGLFAEYGLIKEGAGSEPEVTLRRTGPARLLTVWVEE